MMAVHTDAASDGSGIPKAGSVSPRALRKRLVVEGLAQRDINVVFEHPDIVSLMTEEILKEAAAGRVLCEKSRDALRLKAHDARRTFVWVGRVCYEIEDQIILRTILLGSVERSALRSIEHQKFLTEPWFAGGLESSANDASSEDAAPPSSTPRTSPPHLSHWVPQWLRVPGACWWVLTASPELEPERVAERLRFWWPKIFTCEIRRVALDPNLPPSTRALVDHTLPNAERVELPPLPLIDWNRVGWKTPRSALKWWDAVLTQPAPPKGRLVTMLESSAAETVLEMASGCAPPPSNHVIRLQWEDISKPRFVMYPF